MRSKLVLLLVATGMLVGLTSCGSRHKTYSRTFETVWKTLNDTYFDRTFGGVNWKDAHDRYRPQIAAAERDEDFYAIVNRMLWELNVSHANLIPPGSLARREPLVCAEGSPGVDVRVLNGAAVTKSVVPGSPAHRAGLRPGHLIRAIDGVAVEQIVQEAGAVARPPDNSRNRVAIITKAILGRIYGAPGTEVSIAYSDAEGKTRERTMTRTKRSGTAVGPRGILYLAVELEARRLENGIGYIRVNTLQPLLAARVSGAIRSMGQVAAMILDLRGNAGGEIEGMPELFLEGRAFRGWP